VEQLDTSLPHKPRIAKLKALFERCPAARESRSLQSKQRNCQIVARSHSLGAMRVKGESQEDQVVVKAEGCGEGKVNSSIFCHGILRVPQLSTVRGSTPTVRPALPVKRSKSLKVLGSNQHCKLSLATAVSPITQLNTSDDTAGSEASAASVKPPDRIPLSRGESASNLKPFVPPKKCLTASSGEVNVNKFDIDNCRSSNQENKQFKSHTQRHWMNYESSHVVPRRRRSLESVNFEDAAIPDGCSLDCRDLVLPPSQQSQLMDGDACKVLQDCEDYLIKNIKCDVSCYQPGKKVQNSSETADTLTLEAQRKVNAIVAGLGVRERRNSFRQAVGTSQEDEVKSSRKLRDYEAVWPSGNIAAAPLNGSNAQAQECFSLGSYVNVISENSSIVGSHSMLSQSQQTKGKSGNWLQTHHPQNSRDVRFQQLEERKCSPLSSGLMKNSVSQVKGQQSVERSEPEQNVNAYVKVGNSDVRLGKLGVKPKPLLRSKMLTPDRRGAYHGQMGTDPGFSANKSTSSGFCLSVDASNIFQSSPCKLTEPKSTVLCSRKPKNTTNFRSATFKAYPKQENSLQTAADHDLRTSQWPGKISVTGKVSAKEVPYKCSPNVPCHRNATGLVVSHGPSPRVGNAVQSQYKLVPAAGDGVSRPTEINSSSHTAAPSTQLKKQNSMQEVSYGMYCMLILTPLHGNVLFIMCGKVTVFQYTDLLSIFSDSI